MKKKRFLNTQVEIMGNYIYRIYLIKLTHAPTYLVGLHCVSVAAPRWRVIIWEC